MNRGRNHQRPWSPVSSRIPAWLDPAPGKHVEYMVVDDDAESRNRIWLPHEEGEEYDVEYTGSC
jgi:hypothetical protein